MEKKVSYGDMQAPGGTDLCLLVITKEGEFKKPVYERGFYHKRGNWTYTESSVVCDEGDVLLLRTFSTHHAGHNQLLLRRAEKRAWLFRGRYDEAPRWDAHCLKNASEIFGISIEVIKNAVRRILPEDARRFDSAVEITAEY